MIHLSVSMEQWCNYLSVWNSGVITSQLETLMYLSLKERDFYIYKTVCNLKDSFQSRT